MADAGTHVPPEQTIMIAGKRVPVSDPNAAALVAYNMMMLALPKDQREQVLTVMEDGSVIRAAETQAPCQVFRYAFTDSAGDFVCVCGHRAATHQQTWP